MKKYYIDDNPIISGGIEKWDLLVSSLDIENATIEVVEELKHNTDKIDRLKINELLNNKVSYFKSQQPFERTVSLSPFLTKNNYNSVCFKYHLTADTIKELKTTWKNGLKETCVISPFIVFKNKMPILWVNFFGTVAYLNNNELEFWKQSGFYFVEHVLELNKITYGIN